MFIKLPLGLPFLGVECSLWDESRFLVTGSLRGVVSGSRSAGSDGASLEHSGCQWDDSQTSPVSHSHIQVMLLTSYILHNITHIQSSCPLNHPIHSNPIVIQSWLHIISHHFVQWNSCAFFFFFDSQFQAIPSPSGPLRLPEVLSWAPSTFGRPRFGAGFGAALGPVPWDILGHDLSPLLNTIPTPWHHVIHIIASLNSIKNHKES